MIVQYQIIMLKMIIIYFVLSNFLKILSILYTNIVSTVLNIFFYIIIYLINFETKDFFIVKIIYKLNCSKKAILNLHTFLGRKSKFYFQICVMINKNFTSLL